MYRGQGLVHGLMFKHSFSERVWPTQVHTATFATEVAFRNSTKSRNMSKSVKSEILGVGTKQTTPHAMAMV